MLTLRERVEKELLGNILPFWLKHTPDNEHGGFCGQIKNDLSVDPSANKGLILNARILWTFSAAHKVYGDELYLKTARRAFEYLLENFWDRDFGGMYWMVDCHGNPVETKKRIYGQAFTLYALAEYASECAGDSPLQRAIALHRLIEQASHDRANCGYYETYERDWTLAADQRLSDVDMDETKSMNTHLHMLEAYTNLLRRWNDPLLRERLRELLRIFLDRIIHPDTHHFRMFFDKQWDDRSRWTSFGHDIEGSWLICEAAEVLGDPEILTEARNEAVRMAQAVYEQALDSDGGLLYEGKGNEIIDGDKHWWPQAEAVVGFLNAYELSGRDYFLRASERTWAFIENCIVDHQFGEWHSKVSRDGTPSNDKHKVDAWKCPYHNSRCCFQVMKRLDKLAEQHRV
jgi:mannobiose 2-epimerase